MAVLDWGVSSPPFPKQATLHCLWLAITSYSSLTSFSDYAKPLCFRCEPVFCLYVSTGWGSFNNFCPLCGGGGGSVCVMISSILLFQKLILAWEQRAGRFASHSDYDLGWCRADWVAKIRREWSASLGDKKGGIFSLCMTGQRMPAGSGDRIDWLHQSRTLLPLKRRREWHAPFQHEMRILPFHHAWQGWSPGRNGSSIVGCFRNGSYEADWIFPYLKHWREWCTPLGDDCRGIDFPLWLTWLGSSPR